MSVPSSFDVLLRGGRVIDPASGIDGTKDVATRGGKIAAVQADILPTSGGAEPGLRDRSPWEFQQEFDCEL
jgi:N-acyl-D-aspartate/D-glutamate deacylase